MCNTTTKFEHRIVQRRRLYVLICQFLYMTREKSTKLSMAMYVVSIEIVPRPLGVASHNRCLRLERDAPKNENSMDWREKRDHEHVGPSPPHPIMERPHNLFHDTLALDIAGPATKSSYFKFQISSFQNSWFICSPSTLS
jgi:hypothetical protein